ncbi:MAG TPA: hypothetical protein VFA98_13540 [Thermoanaerobaculia bacterium]|nr:hypothetical protein [Thermoanaerobaculia bacterium]
MPEEAREARRNTLMNLSDTDLMRIREKMDLTDVQVEQLKDANARFPKTAKATEAFGEALRKIGVSEEHQIKIARLIGPVLEAVAKEAQDQAWQVVDRHLAKLGEIASSHDAAMKELEGGCASIDGSIEGDPLDLAEQAERARDAEEG